MYYDKYLKYKMKYLNLKKKMAESNQIGGKNNDSLEMYKWIKYYKPKHLTVHDLKTWKTNQTKKVLVLDRNFEEYHIWNDLEENKSYSPEQFFKKNICKIKNNGDLTWDIIDSSGDKNCYNVEINVKVLGSNLDWCPVFRSNPNLASDGDYVTIYNKKGNKHKIYWDELASNVRIGWRGPMILWEHVKNNPKVYWVNSFSESESI
jgi:hypothetical protein